LLLYSSYLPLGVPNWTVLYIINTVPYHTFEGLHTYGVYTLSGLRSSKAAEEEGFGPEIQQHDNVRLVEFPLTCGRNSKRGSQAREERMKRWDE
jgi:hypothetical protein